MAGKRTKAIPVSELEVIELNTPKLTPLEWDIWYHTLARWMKEDIESGKFVLGQSKNTNSVKMQGRTSS